MSNVHPLADRAPARRPVYFSRHELNLLLSLYSRRVARGEWRDYAIDHERGVAAFSVFRHSQDRALFRIFKVEDADRGCVYQVSSGPRRLGIAASLGEALSVFERRLELVV